MKKAVLYLRMSSDQQEGSIEQQRPEVLALLKQNGYTLASSGFPTCNGEYVDEGLSASKDQEKRVAFAQLLADAKAKKFDVILCWNTSRITRQDSIEASFAKGILRDAGVRLHTVREGVIDWNTFQGRLTDAIYTELNNLYSVNLANDCMRGRLAVLEGGFWPSGSVPYGYDRLYVSPTGDQRLVLRSEPFSKPPKHMLRLVVNKDDAQTVRDVFDLYTERDLSARAIVKHLNTKGVKSPTAAGKGNGLCWNVQMILSILTNPAYIGIG